MESQDQQNLCNRVIFHLFENFEKEMSIDFFIPTLKSQIAAAGVIDWFPIFMQE
jgi:hypothetical protein